MLLSLWFWLANLGSRGINLFLCLFKKLIEEEAVGGGAQVISTATSEAFSKHHQLTPPPPCPQALSEACS